MGAFGIMAMKVYTTFGHIPYLGQSMNFSAGSQIRNLRTSVKRIDRNFRLKIIKRLSGLVNGISNIKGLFNAKM